jgi:hypothetical protein
MALINPRLSAPHTYKFTDANGAVIDLIVDPGRKVLNLGYIGDPISITPAMAAELYTYIQTFSTTNALP